MGNGPRLKKTIAIDIETQGLNQPALTEQDIEDLANQAQAAFGQPNQVFMSAPNYAKLHAFFQMGGAHVVEMNPEFRGTPWATMARLTKRERQVAKLHIFLKKLSILRLSEDEMQEVVNKSVKRLKRARWSKYNYQGKKAE